MIVMPAPANFLRKSCVSSEMIEKIFSRTVTNPAFNLDENIVLTLLYYIWTSSYYTYHCDALLSHGIYKIIVPPLLLLIVYTFIFVLNNDVAASIGLLFDLDLACDLEVYAKYYLIF